MKSSSMTVVLVAIVLLIGSVQCVTACTSVPGASAQPSCHHHKQAPASQKTADCCHELVPATTVQSSVDHPMFSAEAVDAPSVAGALVSVGMPAVHDAFPPGLGSHSLSVLRI